VTCDMGRNQKEVQWFSSIQRHKTQISYSSSSSSSRKGKRGTLHQSNGLSWWCISFLDMEWYIHSFSTSFRKQIQGVPVSKVQYRSMIWMGYHHWPTTINSYFDEVKHFDFSRSRSLFLSLSLFSGLLFVYHTVLPRIVYSFDTHE
jgi:hypothetical protein